MTLKRIALTTALCALASSPAWAIMAHPLTYWELASETSFALAFCCALAAPSMAFVAWREPEAPLRRRRWISCGVYSALGALFSAIVFVAPPIPLHSCTSLDYLSDSFGCRVPHSTRTIGDR